MPSYEEVDAAGGQAFVPPVSSNLREAPSASALATALGLTDATPDDDDGIADPSKEEGVRKYEEKADEKILKAEERIQVKAEELYQTAERAALVDASYLPTLLDSKDTADRKLAEKIILRNAEKFGASSVDEYRKSLILKKEADPVKQQLAVQDLEIASLKETQAENRWREWKRDHRVTGDMESQADAVRTLYPSMPEGDILATARGRMGLANPHSTKAASAASAGGGTPSEEDESALESPLAKRLLHDPKKTMKFAREYVKNL